MKSGFKQKIVKKIRVHLDKCIGCRACEIACSAFHALPKYSSINPARARIRVVNDQLKGIFVPIRAGNYSESECSGRYSYTIDAKEYPECCFCVASCPSRNRFKEPDSGVPLKCDMCQDNPPISEPMCVQVCRPGALTYEESEEIVEQEPQECGDMEIVFESLVKKHGKKKVMDTFTRLSRS